MPSPVAPRHSDGMTSNDTLVAAPPPAGPTARPPLRRSTTDRIIGGVCGGIAQRFGVDPLIIRVAFVVAVLAGGSGLLMYLALWLIVPDDRDTTSASTTRSPVRLILGILLGVGAVFAALSWLTQLGGLAGVVVGGFIVGVVIWLYQRPRTAPPPVAHPDPDWAPPTGFAYGGTGYPATSAATPLPPRNPSYLGLITLGFAILVGAGLAAATAAGIISVGIVAGLAAVLGVLALGLLVGAFRGHAKWLVAIALPLALLLGVAGQVQSFIPGQSLSNVGVRSWQPTGPAALNLGAGEAVLDLRPWAATGTPPGPRDVVAADVGLGQLTVIVPPTWKAEITATARAGEIVVNGKTLRSDTPSQQFDGTLTPSGGGDATGTITLVLSVDMGEIDIRQDPMTSPLTGRTPPPTAGPETSRNQTKEPTR